MFSSDEKQNPGEPSEEKHARLIQQTSSEILWALSQWGTNF